MKKALILFVYLLCYGSVFADTQDYIKCDIVHMKSNVVYFDAGSSDGVRRGETFEIYYDERIVASGKIDWADPNISRSEELDSTVFAEIFFYDELTAKIRLFVEQASRGGYLNIPYFSDLNLEPLSICTPDDRMVARLIHRGLLTRDENRMIVPDLAGVYEVRGLTYTFYIDQDAVFHSGKPVEATDVAYSLEQVARSSKLTPATSFVLEIRGATEYRHGMRNEISGIFLINRKTLSITLKRPFPAFEDYLAGPGGYIIPKPGLVQPGGYVIGSGPYRIKWRNFDGLALEPAAYGGLESLLDSLIFARFTNIEEAALSLELGRLDLIAVLGEPTPKFISSGNHTSITNKTTSSVILGVNGKREFQRNGRFSKALSFLFDRETIIRVILGNSAGLPKSPIPGLEEPYVELDFAQFPDSVDYYLNSIDELPSNVTLYIDSHYPVLKKVARYISGQLQNLGIMITEKTVDMMFLDEGRITSDLDLYLNYHIPISDSPDCLLYPLYSYSLTGQTNFLYYNDDAFQAFLEKLHTETTEERRRIITMGLAQSLVDEPPAIVLYQPYLTTIAKNDIAGLKPLPEGYLDLRGAYIESN